MAVEVVHPRAGPDDVRRCSSSPAAATSASRATSRPSARDAARAASLETPGATAAQAARATVAASLDGSDCKVAYNADWRPDGTVRCSSPATSRTAASALIGLPGHVTIDAESHVRLDPYRSLDDPAPPAPTDAATSAARQRPSSSAWPSRSLACRRPRGRRRRRAQRPDDPRRRRRAGRASPAPRRPTRSRCAADDVLSSTRRQPSSAPARCSRAAATRAIVVGRDRRSVTVTAHDSVPTKTAEPDRHQRLRHPGHRNVEAVTRDP